MNRDDALARLRDGVPPDLLVIGGGIAGAGVALEAARAGVRVALVEARDFASGTSSRSSKMVHGGLRYLAQGHIGLTREAVRARDALIRDAAGLVQPLRFVLPVRDGDARGRRTLGIGLALYDALAGRRTRQWHDAPALLALAPVLDAGGLRGGWSYLDARVDDARLVLRVLAEAHALGATVVNHVRVEALARGAAGVNGAHLRDTLDGTSFTLPARCVINATGAWADALRGSIGRAPVLRPLRGSHLLLPGWRLPLGQAVTLLHPRDGRPVFALPWEGATLVGTTDLDHRDDLEREPGISRDEVDYLLEALQQAFPSLELVDADVRSTWAGVRPVVSSGRAVAPSKETREHVVIDEDGLITVTGGKLTTFRAMALQALRRAARHVPELAVPRPRAAMLECAPASATATLGHVPARLRERWIGRFGARAEQVLETARDGELETIAGTDTSWAEVRWACRNEAVAHLDDLLLRRTRLGLLLADGAAAMLAQLRPIAQTELGWSDAHWSGECSRYRALIACCHGVPPRGPATSP